MLWFRSLPKFGGLRRTATREGQTDNGGGRGGSTGQGSRGGCRGGMGRDSGGDGAAGWIVGEGSWTGQGKELSGPHRVSVATNGGIEGALPERKKIVSHKL